MLFGSIVPAVLSCSREEAPLLQGRFEVRKLGVALQGDSTHKIGYQSGWEFAAIGSHSQEHSKLPAYGYDQLTHTFRPWIFMYFKSTTSENLDIRGWPA